MIDSAVATLDVTNGMNMLRHFAPILGESLFLTVANATEHVRVPAPPAPEPIFDHRIASTPKAPSDDLGACNRVVNPAPGWVHEHRSLPTRRFLRNAEFLQDFVSGVVPYLKSLLRHGSRDIFQCQVDL